MTTSQLQVIPIEKLHESPLNTRSHFDTFKLANLTASMRTHGQLTPILVRPIAKGFEIAAGHRRFRAAKAAGLPSLEAKVRELDEAAFVEILTIENDEREDVHPLEQAQGYKLLMERAGYDVAKIASRLQRGHDFVYDRLSLLKLLPALKKHFLEGHFELGHAIILAKLAPSEQTRAASLPDSSAQARYNDFDEGGLWETDRSLFDREDDPAEGTWLYKPRSVGELRKWVNDNIRFRPEDVELEIEYPETAFVLESAEETGTKVIHITAGYMLSSEARDPNVRTYGERSWERADGLEGSKECEKSVVGLFVDGDERGTTLAVCVSRDTCLVHWKENVTAAAARKKDRAKANDGDQEAAKRVANQPAAKKDAATIAREEREEKIEEKFPAMAAEAARKIVRSAPASDLGATGKVGRFVLDEICDGSSSLYGKPNKKKIGTTAVDLVRFLALEYIDEIETEGYSLEDRLKPLGIDLKAIRKAIEASIPIKPVPAAAKKKGKAA